MINITLPDGSVKEFAKGSTPMDVAKSISEGLARNVISAAFNGTTVETETELTTDGSLILYTWNARKLFCHPCHSRCIIQENRRWLIPFPFQQLYH